MSGACTYFYREVSVTVKEHIVHIFFRSQFFHLRYVVSHIHIQVKSEILCFYQSGIQHQFHALIGYHTCIYPLSSTPGSCCGYFHNLVLCLAVIISKIKSQAIVQELHIQTRFVRSRDFRLQLVVHLHIVFGRGQYTIIEFERVGVV